MWLLAGVLVYTCAFVQIGSLTTPPPHERIPPLPKTAVAALTVSLLFWAVLFPAIGRTSLVDVHCHAVNSLIVLVDLTLTHVPYYLKVRACVGLDQSHGRSHTYARTPACCR